VRAAAGSGQAALAFCWPWALCFETPEHDPRSDRAGLTFELSGRHRQGAWAARRMICLTPRGPSALPVEVRSSEGLGLTRHADASFATWMHFGRVAIIWPR
jgi:hypothetical protein